MPRLRHSIPLEATEVIAPKGLPHRWKKGESGNPKGRPVGSRNVFARDFFVDFHRSWIEHGKAALDTTAMLYPNEYVRAAAMVMPKEFNATITKINIGRLSNAELDALIDREIRGAADQKEAAEDPPLLQHMES